ncbi:MAG: hypothetical protein QW272_08885 [Candidatus Methanomethylicaceae archaeon]
MSFVYDVPIKIIPGIKMKYSVDSKYGVGSLFIKFKKNDKWVIGLSGTEFVYVLPSLTEHVQVYLDISNEALRTIWERDEKTGKRYVKEIPNWLIEDYGAEFKVITHSINEIEIAEELIEPKLTKQIPKTTLEYYEKNKILKIPFFNDEIRINIENENLEYIRNNKKLIKAIPLNKEIHFYGIEPKVLRYIVTPEGAKLASTN